MIATIILVCLLGLSVLSNIGSFFGSLFSLEGGRLHRDGPRFEEVVIEDSDATDTIAVIEVEGIISSMALQGPHSIVDVVKAQLKAAKRDKTVKAVVLKVDSPGGEVLASDEIYRAIEQFQKETDKPVVASMGSLAASGGYYVSAPCRWIVAHDMTITGSIGVIMSGLNYRGLLDKVGVQPMVFKSGKHKDMLSGMKPPAEITEEEKDIVRKLISETYGKFKDVVARGRATAAEANRKSAEGRPLAADWADFADGRILSGGEAYKLGFVDELGDFQTAVKRAKKLAKLADARLVEYRLWFDFADLFRIFGKSAGQGVKLDLGFEPPKLEAGKMYFLLPTLAP